jgi:hypothetical protein
MAFEADARVPPVVIYDANLLYPFHTRNLFVQLGVHHFVAPRWTDAIHDEWLLLNRLNGRNVPLRGHWAGQV